MLRNEFRLSANKPSYYLNLFDAAEFQISKKSDENTDTDIDHAYDYEAVLRVGEETSGLSFEIYIELQDAFLTTEIFERARSAVSNIVDMDITARAIGNNNRENEQLAYITLIDDMIRLRYWATTFNTEWDVVFKTNDANELVCLGIPDWRNPGLFIQ